MHWNEVELDTIDESFRFLSHSCRLAGRCIAHHKNVINNELMLFLNFLLKSDRSLKMLNSQHCPKLYRFITQSMHCCLSRLRGRYQDLVAEELDYRMIIDRSQVCVLVAARDSRGFMGFWKCSKIVALMS
uniref:Uncharacterized protein n=1 Tax=Glossina austeni TaxID=7395 RepID=A0A1A9VYU8_GLOAU